MEFFTRKVKFFTTCSILYTYFEVWTMFVDYNSLKPFFSIFFFFFALGANTCFSFYRAARECLLVVHPWDTILY